MGKPNVSNSQIITNLTTSFEGDAGHTETWHTDLIRFSLPNTSPKGPNNEAKGFQTLTNNEANFARLAFSLWDDLIPKTLSETNGNNARITFAYSSTTKPDGTGNPGTYTSMSFGTKHSDRDIHTAQVWIASSWTNNQSANVTLGSYGLETYIHEIGHSLGLSHPGLYDASDKNGPTYDHDATYSRDTRQYTVMSYFKANADGSGADWKGSSASTPMVDDILAIQAKYGADTSTRSGSTTYGFNSNAGRSVYDFTQNTNAVFTIWDGGGTDALDASGYGNNQIIDLNAGHYSSIGRLKQNIGIAYNVTIEKAVGGTGNDTITGNDADNTLTGGNGDDTLNGGRGDDVLVGGNGDDVYNLFDMANGRHDSVREENGGGNDIILITDIHSSVRTYTLGHAIERGAIVGPDASGFALFGNELNNELFDDRGGNELFGQRGNDTLDGGGGMDTLQGGEDDDVYHLYDVTRGAYDKVLELGGGNDTVLVKDLHGKVRSYTLTDAVERGAIVGHDASLFTLYGNDLGNQLFDDTGNNSLYGQGVNDTLDGGAGNDHLDGGTGDDKLIGGTGNDYYVVDSLSDVVTEKIDGGRDLVYTDLPLYTLTANVENLYYVGPSTSGFVATGNDLDNTIVGGDGEDTIDGGKGADVLTGKGASDVYIIDNSGDIIKEAADGGTNDYARVYVTSYTLGANVETMNYLGKSTADFTGTGNDSDNTITGWLGDDTIDGGAGADYMKGLGGNDTYWVDNVGDVVEDTGGAKDRINVRLTSYTLGAGIEELNYAGPDRFASFVGTGNELDNLIIGWSGSDTLDGKAGDDTLDGRSGDDVYNLFDVTNGHYDTVVENKNAGNDIVLVRDLHGDVHQYTLTANVERGGIIGHDASGFTLHGNDIDNELYDDYGNNSLFGEGGDDMLDSGNGADVMNGGAGKDTFVFGADLSDANADVISDFTLGDDTIALHRSKFTGLGAVGALAGGAFFAGSAANDDDDRVIYDASTGKIFYDGDGTGAQVQVLLATVTANLALTAAEFAIIA